MSGTVPRSRARVPMFFYSEPITLLARGVVFFAMTILPACSSSVADKRADSAGSEQRIQVRAVPVKVEEVRRNIQSVGSLFALEEVTVSSEVEGKVEEV